MTAVEIIEDYLKFKGIIIDDKTIPQVLVGVINHAKEMEKKQIIDAYIRVNYKSNRDMYWKIESAEKHYNETFNK
jgi:hypothetical protein